MGEGSSKRHKKTDACISTKVSSKKIKLHKLCFNELFFLRPSTLISRTINVCTIGYHSYTLNVTLTAKIKMSLWNTYINNYRALFNKMSDVYK